MVERAYLDKQLIDSSEPPEKGERWISDTAIKGFGLRVWRNAKGEVGAAYCVRASNPEGKSIRRSLSYWDCQAFHISLLDPWESWQYRETYNPDETLGDLVAAARIWATDTINGIKRKAPTRAEIAAEIQEEERKHQDALLKRLSSYTLEKSSDVIIQGSRARGLSEEYCIRIDTLFHRYVSNKIKNTHTHKITTEDFAEIFRSNDLSKSNMKALRSHLRRCLEISDSNGLRTATRPSQLIELAAGAIKDRPIGTIFENWSRHDQEMLLNWLIKHERHWQQSLCLLFYLESSLPLSRLLKTTWKQCGLTLTDNIEAISTNNNIVISLGRRWRLRHSLDAHGVRALTACQQRNLEAGISKDFLFPSAAKTNRSFHISSVQTILHALKRKFNLPDFSIFELKEDWQQSNAFTYRALAGAMAKREKYRQGRLRKDFEA